MPWCSQEGRGKKMTYLRVQKRKKKDVHRGFLNRERKKGKETSLLMTCPWLKKKENRAPLLVREIFFFAPVKQCRTENTGKNLLERKAWVVRIWKKRRNPPHNLLLGPLLEKKHPATSVRGKFLKKLGVSGKKLGPQKGKG